jgi:hypothetical protein
MSEHTLKTTKIEEMRARMHRVLTTKPTDMSDDDRQLLKNWEHMFEGSQIWNIIDSMTDADVADLLALFDFSLGLRSFDPASVLIASVQDRLRRADGGALPRDSCDFV